VFVSTGMLVSSTETICISMLAVSHSGGPGEYYLFDIHVCFSIINVN